MPIARHDIDIHSRHRRQQAGGPTDPHLYEAFVPGIEDGDFGRLAARDERAEALHEAIDLLPRRQQQVVLLTLEGLSGVQIADQLGVTQQGVSQALVAAKATLADELAGLY